MCDSKSNATWRAKKQASRQMLTRFLVCSLWVVFTVTFSPVNSSPLKGEMSSTRRRQRGYMRVNQLTSLRFALYKIFSSVSAQGAEPHTFVGCDKSMQKHALCHRSERSHNHRQSLFELIFILLFLLTFSAVFRRCLSVIIPFLLTASWVIFSAHLCF